MAVRLWLLLSVLVHSACAMVAEMGGWMSWSVPALASGSPRKCNPGVSVILDACLTQCPVESVPGRLGEARFLCTVVGGVDEAGCCGEAWEKVFSFPSDGGSVSVIDEASMPRATLCCLGSCDGRVWGACLVNRLSVRSLLLSDDVDVQSCWFLVNSCGHASGVNLLEFEGRSLSQRPSPAYMVQAFQFADQRLGSLCSFPFSPASGALGLLVKMANSGALHFTDEGGRWAEGVGHSGPNLFLDFR